MKRSSNDRAPITRSNHAGFVTETTTGPLFAGLCAGCDYLPRLPAAPVTVPAPMTVTMAPPAHLGRGRLGILLHGIGSAGAAQRERLRALGWHGEREQCADGREPHNIRHLHVEFSFKTFRGHVCNAI